MLKRNDTLPFTLEIVTDPIELELARKQHERSERNFDWLDAHAHEVYAESNRGQYVCIAGEECFVAPKAEDAKAQACAKHPEDNGAFLLYIPKVKAVRVYANQR